MTATSEALLITSQEGAVRTLTLNRPAALNAFTTALLVQLREALEAAAQDAGVRCVVITGAGRGFSAGQDLSDALIKPPMEPGEVPKDIGHLLDNYYIPLALRLRSMPVPVIAAVNGVAAGAGASLALGCDLVLAAEGASFIQAFSKIGLVPDCGGTWLLPRLVGRAKALELALLGDKLPAAEAARIGLIYRALPDAELAAEAQALAQKLAAMPVKAIAATRQALDDALLLDFESALKNEALLQSRLGFAVDYQEGTRAFLEKRKPNFSDR
ncbi:2-(1,2-epoxy-1,2-dihydrophenyl)acetyl-CoA isomerase [Roseateles sp. DAIF2]|uniref:enoyl-CoA hydratase-related protein n=1 Tax=Roseateles sp. DAIF2 TaxID=2714952 RepID=UPI0018A2643A|nr:enoyl-CoA hydratase-related protein [Roseateles sp. DAIF2]QPF74746.1 2-(1,2-epoxy-1,2-dihydrophenyl)acetyl-CoA isomerase [Roseateles sp. DAIF2]